MGGNSIKLKAVGDIMLGDHPVCYGHGVRSVIERKGFDFLTEGLESVLEEKDLLFCNLESVLSDFESDPKSLPKMELRGRPDEAECLAKLGFDILNVANNHALQHGVTAFDETVSLVADKGMHPIGLSGSSGDSKVFEWEKDGVKIDFISYSMRPEKFSKGEIPYARGEKDDIISFVRDRRSQTDAVIVLSLHWGDEYMNYPSAEQISMARELVDVGVNLILGHHPHVLQGVEKYRGGVIVYSLGNFVFDKWQRNPRETAVFSCEIGIDGVIEYELIPILIAKSFQPMSVKGKDAEKIQSKLSDYSRALKLIVAGEGKYAAYSGDSYKAMSERAYLKFRIQSYLYFFTRIYKYSFSMISFSFFRFVLRRFGKD